MFAPCIDFDPFDRALDRFVGLYNLYKIVALGVFVALTVLPLGDGQIDPRRFFSFLPNVRMFGFRSVLDL